MHQMTGRYADQLGFARTADEVEAVFASGRIASLMGAEGGHSIGCSLATLRLLHVLGVRYMTLTHNDNVAWADSATDEPVHHGLSPFGVEVVREMNRIGMLVDLSHVSADTMRDALRVSEVPVMFSHSSARAVCDMTRNVPDDVLETLRDRRGVCMVTFVPEFVSPEAARWRTEAAAAAARGRRQPDRPPGLRGVHRHVEPRPPQAEGDASSRSSRTSSTCARSPASTASASAATTTGPTSCRSGWRTSAATPGCSPRSPTAGWSDADLAKLAGGNVLRVMRDAEAGARELQATRGPEPRPYEDLDGRPRRRGRHRRRLTARALLSAEAGDGEADQAGDHQRDVHHAGHLLDHDERPGVGQDRRDVGQPDAGHRREREVEQLQPRPRRVGVQAAVNEPGQMICMTPYT